VRERGVEGSGRPRARWSGSLLQRMSWMFVLLNLLLAALSVLTLTYPDAPPWPAAGIRTGAFLGLGIWAVAYYLFAGRVRALDLVPFPLLVVGGLMSGTTDEVFGRVYVALFLHALLHRSGGWRRGLLLSSGYALTYETVGWVTTSGSRHVAQMVSTVIGVVIVTWIMQSFASAMVRHERETARHGVLTDLVAALLSERDQDRIGALVADGVLRLIESSGAVATVWRGNARRLGCVGVAGAARPAMEVEVDRLPEEVKDAFLDCRTQLLPPLGPQDAEEGIRELAPALIATIPGDGAPAGMILLSSAEPLDRDLTGVMQRLAYEVSLAEQLADRDALFASVVGSSPDLIAVLDGQSRFTYLSPALVTLAGMEPAELVGKPLGALLTSMDGASPIDLGGADVRTPILLRMDGVGSSVEVEAIASRLGADGMVLNVRDISERLRLEEEIRHRAFHDSLTGLANRALFLDRLTHALQRCARTGAAIAVAMIDVDEFKAVNDTLGHAAGDVLLVEVARRVGAVGREADTAARLGGDEFVLLVEAIDGEGDANAVGARLLHALRQPVEVEGRELRISASVGIVVVAGGAGGDDVLRQADAAMYAAKSAGKNQHAVVRADLGAVIP
jgi:diguanylate cyclase (GGDEF)-like protein/PAS domain S-box-containing protein